MTDRAHSWWLHVEAEGVPGAGSWDVDPTEPVLIPGAKTDPGPSSERSMPHEWTLVDVTGDLHLQPGWSAFAVGPHCPAGRELAQPIIPVADYEWIRVRVASEAFLLIGVFVSSDARRSHVERLRERRGRPLRRTPRESQWLVISLAVGDGQKSVRFVLPPGSDFVIGSAPECSFRLPVGYGLISHRLINNGTTFVLLPESSLLQFANESAETDETSFGNGDGVVVQAEEAQWRWRDVCVEVRYCDTETAARAATRPGPS